VCTQMVLLTMALAETWATFLLANRFNRPAAARSIDAAVQCFFPLVYVSTTASLLFLPFSGVAAVCVAALASVIVGFVTFRAGINAFRMTRLYRLRLIDTLHQHLSARVSENNEEAIGLMDDSLLHDSCLLQVTDRLFQATDRSGGGTLESLELKLLLVDCFPDLSKGAHADLMKDLGWHDRKVEGSGVAADEFHHIFPRVVISRMTARDNSRICVKKFTLARDKWRASMAEAADACADDVDLRHETLAANANVRVPAPVSNPHQPPSILDVEVSHDVRSIGGAAMNGGAAINGGGAILEQKTGCSADYASPLKAQMIDRQTNQPTAPVDASAGIYQQMKKQMAAMPTAGVGGARPKQYRRRRKGASSGSSTPAPPKEPNAAQCVPDGAPTDGEANESDGDDDIDRDAYRRV